MQLNPERQSRMKRSGYSLFDEGPDLVLYYKYLLDLGGSSAYELHFNASDALSASQREHARMQWERFKPCWVNWPGAAA
jgi:4-hydroxy-tetrahydrodipicolinate synthase